MSTRDLINAIAAGDAIEIENAFNSVMAEKISSRIDELRIDVAQNLFAEEVEEIEEEQLDEISKKTLGSYVSKAAPSLAHRAQSYAASKDDPDDLPDDEDEDQNKHYRKMDNRITGIQRASKKLAKEEFELNLEDYSLEEIEDYMMSEDFEQLDELSKDTLTSYVDKANRDIPKKMKDERRTRNTILKVRDSAHRKYMSGDRAGEKSREKLGNAILDKANKTNRKIYHRQKGVERAQDRISYQLDK